MSTTQSGLVATASLATGQENGGIIDAVVQAAATQPIGPTVSSVLNDRRGDHNAGKAADANARHERGRDGYRRTPTLTLNDGGTATYTGGSGTNTLTFSYTVGAGQNTTAPDGDGGQRHDHGRWPAIPLNTANLPETFSGVTQIDTTTPVISVDCGVAIERRPQRRQDSSPTRSP